MPSSPKRGLTAAEEKTFLRYYVRLLLEDPDKINNLNKNGRLQRGGLHLREDGDH